MHRSSFMAPTFVHSVIISQNTFSSLKSNLFGVFPALGKKNDYLAAVLLCATKTSKPTIYYTQDSFSHPSDDSFFWEMNL